MHIRSILGITALMLILAVSRCSAPSKKEIKTARAFYHWKSVFAPTGFEKKTLSSLDVKTVYLKFFDVDWDNNLNRPLPVAQISAKDTGYLQKDLQVVPVIFITNSCVRHLDSLQGGLLAEKIVTLVNATCQANGLKFAELQIDCDWTEQTREPYFAMLRAIKLQQPATTLSATIRLYQVKYLGKTGVPPVDRGMLMAYNMGNLRDPSSINSILDTKELKKYLTGLLSYPLALDVALPLFEWMVLFRKDSYAGLIENLPGTQLTGPAFIKTSANHYRVIKDTVLNGYTFNKDDVVRNESTDYDQLLEAEKMLAKNIRDTTFCIALFHLDSLILKKYTVHEMENIFSGMR